MPIASDAAAPNAEQPGGMLPGGRSPTMQAAFKCSTCLGRLGVGAGIAAFSDTEHDLGFLFLLGAELSTAPPPDRSAALQLANVPSLDAI
ncbi:hypothetical protein [Bradyrhizobium sp. LVM 105]|uniref:hypothetical protein n=1 Tax=Bradyrhizobium sp. LVM 105 TaxID=2341115 RepID=UPI00196B358F|nr:hypothetical protein [Bradyrhizobium sp. LVM 105]